MNMIREKGFTLIEVIAVMVILLMIARFFWASEFLVLENQAISYFGLPQESKYFLTIPLAALWLYTIFKEEKAQAKSDQPVVRKRVIITSISLVVFVIIYLFFIVGIQNV
ncbi:MAG: type II secretion system protein [Gammaproteobacteria bacterium]